MKSVEFNVGTTTLIAYFTRKYFQLIATRMSVRSNPFLRNIEERFNSMRRYEDPRLKSKALQLIPVSLLQQQAQQRMRVLQNNVKKGLIEDMNISIQEFLILELLEWFKDKFFEWVNSPECDYCFSETKFSHMSSDPKLLIETKRVEMHRCVKCGQFTPFYRYTNLEILLETREGRCGEWADVFTLFCRAMGWDTRYVHDETDHIWTEVYSIAQKRWLHCDPCENICDSPLLYECGWNKKLSYIIAYSHEEVQDVTWRYSSNHEQLLQNRTKCTESDLIQTLLRLRENKQKSLSQARRNYLTRRLLLELVELMAEKMPTDSDVQGRTSGSLDWRLQRGETSVNLTSTTWTASKSDLENGGVTIRYSTSLDRYERVSSHGDALEHVTNWENGIFSSRDMFRKEEKDWKVVYLCRKETSTEGEIQWKFEVGNSQFVIDKVTLRFETTLFETGQIHAHICGENKCIPFSSKELITNDFSGSKYILIKAILTGGVGGCAWQHTQLFRQPLNSTEYPFIINITFKTCSVS